MPTTVDAQVLRSLPKVELHCHLEGSIRATTLIDLAGLHGIALPTRNPDELYSFDNLTDFLAVYELACEAVQTPADFALVTYESLEDAVRTSNIVYREIFFNPSLHPGLAYKAMLSGILDGLRAAKRDFGIDAALIPSIYRQLSVDDAFEMLNLVIEHHADEVVGIGMDGDELLDPPEKFTAVYAKAAEARLHRTAHVAHDGPAEMIVTCLDDLGCERVDHGYHVIDDPELMARLAEAGTPFMCATVTPPICGWSAVFDESPIRTMIEAGLAVTLNSDDPTMLNTDLGTEFERVCTQWSLSPERVRKLVTDALDAAWLSEPDRTRITGRILPELDRLLAPADEAAPVADK